MFIRVGWGGAELFDEQCKKADFDLVFVGDSITYYFDAEVWNKYDGKRRALNYGVGYEQTANVLWRIERGHFDVIKPKLIVMMIGTNNTGGAGHKPEMIRDGVAAILQQFRKKLCRTPRCFCWRSSRAARSPTTAAAGTTKSRISSSRNLRMDR